MTTWGRLYNPSICPTCGAYDDGVPSEFEEGEDALKSNRRSVPSPDNDVAADATSPLYPESK